jgi:hypothetical protein
MKKKSLHNIFSREEITLFGSFKKPVDIQSFLNETKYNSENVTRSPRYVIQKKVANCFEGAVFVAAALRYLGYKPLIVDMMAHNDDDHVIALFKQNGFYGAIAKSNTTTLKFREPVYRTLRELVMSYFDFYFNTLGEKTLRSYSNPVDLGKYDKYDWMTTENDLEFIGNDLFEIYHHQILNPKLKRNLSNADKELMDLCFTGSIPEGLFVPGKKKINHH